MKKTIFHFLLNICRESRLLCLNPKIYLLNTIISIVCIRFSVLHLYTASIHQCQDENFIYSPPFIWTPLGEHTEKMNERNFYDSFFGTAFTVHIYGAASIILNTALHLYVHSFPPSCIHSQKSVDERMKVQNQRIEFS